MLWWLENVRIWTNEQLIDGAIEIDMENGTINRISRMAPKPGIDGNGLWALPGMIDIHVHLRDFEESHKEDFRSGSLAALHGGVTTVFDMPNKKPPLITLENLAQAQIKIKKQSLIDIYSYLLFTKEYMGWKSHKYLKGIYGGTFGSQTSSMRDLLWASEHFAGFLALHLEDPAFFNPEALMHHDKRPPKAESEAIRKLITGLSKKRQAHIHIAHLSTEEALTMIIRANDPGITCEATPHHAFLDIDCVGLIGKQSIVNPPLRPPSDRKAIHQGLISGNINIVASDHAPHTIEEKENKEFAGVPGLETTLPLLLTDMALGNLTIRRIIQLFSEGPARLMGLNDRGKICKGHVADLVLVNPKIKWKLAADDLYTKCKWSPFENKKFIGTVAATLKRGTVLFMDENSLPGSFLDQASDQVIKSQDNGNSKQSSNT
jgi:dihydroorotase